MNILKKSLMKVAGIFSAAFICLYAGAAGTATMTIGHSAGKSVTLVSAGKADTAGVALFFPDSYMQSLKGNRITQLQLQVNTMAGKDSLIVFLSRSLDGRPDYEQKVTPGKQKTVTVSLDTPWQLDGKALYIGYKVVGQRYLCFSNTFASGEEMVYKNGAWARYNDTFSATLTARVEGDALPENIRLTGLVMPSYALTSQPVTYYGSLANLGASTVNELTVAYYVDGNAYSRETVSGLAIAPRKRGTFTLSGLSFAEEGDHEVNVQVEAVNGVADGDMTDNRSRSQSLLCRRSFTPRKTLLEVFSTELCTSCPGGHEIINDALAKMPGRVIEVCHHSGFYTDPLTIQPSVDYEWFYKKDHLYAPAVMIDRTCPVADYPSIFSDSVAVISPTSSLEGLLDVLSACPAYASVRLSKSYDASNRRLSVHVEGEQLLPWPHPENLRLNVFVTEDSIASKNQRGASGTFYHRHAVRAVLTPTWGQSVNPDGSYSADFTYTIPAGFDANRMEVVAFVGSYNPEDKTACQVLNAERLAVTGSASSGIQQTKSQKAGLSVAHGVITCGGNTFSVYAANGTLVYGDVIRADMTNRPSGVYVVRAGHQVMKVAF